MAFISEKSFSRYEISIFYILKENRHDAPGPFDANTSHPILIIGNTAGGCFFLLCRIFMLIWLQIQLHLFGRKHAHLRTIYQ